MPEWLAPWWYDFLYTASMTAFTLGFSFRSTGRRNLPRTGPALVLSNHQSYLDPPIVGLGTRRHLRYLARKTLFRHPSFTWLINSLGAVPVDQDGVAKEGMKAVINLLKAGQAVLVFPEGERVPTDQILPFKPGVHLLIRRAPCPIVPVGIAGAFDALPRHRHTPRFAPLFCPPGKASIAVAMGKPLDGKRFAALPREQALAELFAAVQAAKNEAERIRRKPR